MATDSKPIDLGKLQDLVKIASARVKSTELVKLNSSRAVETARNKLARDHETWMKAKEELDRAKAAVLEAARAVANS